MDSLTHGLLGLAIGALRKNEQDRSAVVLGCVLAAELPDLDYLLPASDSVLHALKAHRGISHSLVAVPLIALCATALAKLWFRGARTLSIFSWSVLAALFAHLLADAWTGWGTRLFLPFSSARVTLDWMMVLDPLFTIPLLAGALVALRVRRWFRKAVLAGLALSCLYLTTRIVIKSAVTDKVDALYPSAREITLFPAWIGPTEWRYVASMDGEYAVGRVGAFAAPQEQARHPLAQPLSATVLASDTVREALAWARFPLVEEQPIAGGGSDVRVADLRYHLNGAPTLTFWVKVDAQGRVVAADLDRGGSARALLERFRGR